MQKNEQPKKEERRLDRERKQRKDIARRKIRNWKNTEG